MMLTTEMLPVLSDEEVMAVSGGRGGSNTSSNTVINIIEISVGELVATGHGKIVFNVAAAAYGGGGGGGELRGHGHH